MQKQILENIKISEIIPYERNARKNDHAVKEVVKSIERTGYRTPIIIDENNIILAGHTRYKAIQKLGWKEIPFVVKYLDLDEKQKQEYRIRDNKAGEFAEWDFEILEADFTSDELVDFGFQIKDLTQPEVEEDEAPPPPEIPRTVKGDIYTLGNHRVMCGDSTMIDDVEKLMDGKKADMVFTDPPYGMNLDTDYSRMPGTSTNYKKVIGDDKKFNAGAMMSLIDCPIWYIWGADYFFDTIPKFFDGSITVWAKRQSAQETKVFGSAFEICWVYPKRKKTMWFERAINQSSERLGEHPTQKPVALSVNAFSENMKAINVLDLFLGSGSTLIACEQTNRICYGMELDGKYCDVIVQRWVNFTGGKVILNGQAIEWSKTDGK